MALNDYLEDKVEVTEEFKGVPFRMPEKSTSTLATVDSDMEQAQKAAQIREKRENIERQITNLDKQNADLRARLETVKKNSLSDMDEDKIVAMAKAKGIKNEDIEAWLRGRTSRTYREISLGQKEELGKQAEAESKKATAIEKANKEARKKAILEARNAYETANKPVEPEEYESKVSELDSLEFTFNNLKDSYEEDYKEKLNFKLTPRKVQAKPADDASKTEIPPIPADVELTEDQRREWNKPTTTKDQRDKIIAQIRDKAKAEADKKEKEEKARARKLDAMRGHLKTLGIGKDTNVMKALLEAQNTTDPMIRRALDEVTAFLRSDKDYKTYADLKKLLK